METRQIFTASPLRNFSYIVHNTTVAWVIDPYHAWQIEDYLEQHQLQLRAIINTHEHADHTCGNAELRQKSGCEIWAHKNAETRIPHVTRTLDQDDVIAVSPTHSLKVWDTPGHTFAHVCLLALHRGQPHGIFTGDTLFNAGVGNCHHGGDAQTLHQTINNKFHTLPDDVVIYPGHEYWQHNLAFTLSVEPDNTTARELLAEIKKDSSPPLSTMALERQVNVFMEKKHDKENFLRLRRLRDKW